MNQAYQAAGAWKQEGTGRKYALGDAVRKGLGHQHCVNKGFCTFGLGHSLSRHNCHGLGWTPSEDLAVWLKAVWAIRTQFRGLDLDTLSFAAFGGLEDFLMTLVQMLEERGWTLGEVPEGVADV